MTVPMFRRVRRTYWRITQYMVAGFSREEALEQAKRGHDVYEPLQPQVSVDSGATWHDLPDMRQMPVADETEAVTGRVYGG